MKIKKVRLPRLKLNTKRKRQQKADPRDSGNPLRLSSNKQGGIGFDPYSSPSVSPGSAQGILGISLSPRPKFLPVVTEDNIPGEIAAFTSAGRKTDLLSAEINELRKKRSQLYRERDDPSNEQEKERLSQDISKTEAELTRLMRKMNYSIRGVAYHEETPEESLLMAVKMVPSITFLLRSFLRDTAPFTDRLEKVKHWGNSHYAKYLKDYAYHVLGTSDPTMDITDRNLRDLLYWAEADQILPEPRDITASLDGHVIRKKEAGWMLFETIERYPFSITSRDPFSFKEYPGNPLMFALQKLPYFEDDMYIINNRAYRIYRWDLHFDDSLDRILAQDVDLLTCVDMLPTIDSTRRMFVSVLLRTSSEIVNGQYPKLDATTRQLRRLNAVPLTGEDLRRAFQAFVPGSDILDPSVRYRVHSELSLEEAEYYFNKLSTSINVREATKRGNFFVGFKNGDERNPIFADAESRFVAAALVAVQGGGKTLTGTARFVLPRTPNALVIHWSTAHGEAWPKLVTRLGGPPPLSMDLPDASSEKYPDAMERHAAQRKINEQASQQAKDMVAELKKHWQNTNLPMGLPLVIRPLRDTVAFVVFASTFLDQFSLAYEDCFIPKNEEQKTIRSQPANQLVLTPDDDNKEDELVGLAVDDPRLCVIFLDDINNLDKEAGHPELGDIPMEVAQTAREIISKGLINFRKRRQALIVTVQSLNHLLKFYPADAFSTIITIKQESKSGPKMGTMYDPQGATRLSEMGVVEDNIDFRLPQYLLDYVVPLHDMY